MKEKLTIAQFLRLKNPAGATGLSEKGDIVFLRGGQIIKRKSKGNKFTEFELQFVEQHYDKFSAKKLADALETGRTRRDVEYMVRILLRQRRITHKNKRNPKLFD
jgi:hypothetical protein